MNNIFSGGGFDLISLTAAINRVPDAARYIGMIEKFGIFQPAPISTTTFSVEEYNGVLNLLLNQPRGGPAAKNVSGKRKLRNFAVPHYPLEDIIRVEEIQNVRAFGAESQAEVQANVFARKLGEMRRKHELTREWLRMQCLKGILVDGDNTTIYDYFSEFGITRKTIDFDLDVTTSDINGLCRSVINHMEDNLKGDTMNGVVAFCSRDFYADFINHTQVKEAFKYYTTTQQLSGDFRKQFEFAGIVWVPVGASTTDPAGTARKFVEDGYAYAVPLGTRETFQEVIAPADFLETVNTMGQPFYAKQEVMKYNRGVEVHTQMNLLPICTRPECLVQIGKNID